MDAQRTFAENLGLGLTNGIRFTVRRGKMIMLSYVFIAITGTTLLYMNQQQESSHLDTRSWGGFDEQPVTQKCYRQERIAMLLNLLLGIFGIDQFYAGHWPLGVFKLLTGGGLGLWAFVDQILWMVGGVYGTPGCPGGSSKSWQY